MALRRSLDRYDGCTADAISSGSKAQMMYFVEDAKADIATLAASLSDVLRILEAVKLSAGLGTKQIARMEAARAVLAKATGRVEPKEPDAKIMGGPVNCNTVRRLTGKAMPRTCERCGLGPCPFYDNDGNALKIGGAS